VLELVRLLLYDGSHARESTRIDCDDRGRDFFVNVNLASRLA